MKNLYLILLILWEGAVSTWDAIWYHQRPEPEDYENHGHE